MVKIKYRTSNLKKKNLTSPIITFLIVELNKKKLCILYLVLRLTIRQKDLSISTLGSSLAENLVIHPAPRRKNLTHVLITTHIVNVLVGLFSL